MGETLSFAEFVRCLRVGDDAASRKLVELYEPVIQRAARRGVKDGRLMVACDPLDICQSVLAYLFAGLAAGDYQLDQPEHLVRLLRTMTRNVLASEARRQCRRRRDVRRLAVAGDSLLLRLIDRSPTPIEIALQHELLDSVHATLTDEEWRIVQLHDQGLDWGEIARRLGGSGPARRMQLVRALRRVRRRLRLADREFSS